MFRLRLLTIFIIILSNCICGKALGWWRKNNVPFTVFNNTIEEFFAIKTRNGNNQTTVWYHRGAVKNPSNGKIVAGIEGIEFVQPDCRYPLTYTTKKHFVYVNPTNRSEILNSFRSHPISPMRSIYPSKSFTTVISLISNNVSSHVNVPSNKISIAFPGGRELYSKRFKAESVDNEEILLENAVVSKVPTMAKKWISFGGSETTPRSHESYYIRKSPLASRRWLTLGCNMTEYDISIHYRRFGEGPSWVQPSRPLLIEMDSFRLQYPHNIQVHKEFPAIFSSLQHSESKGSHNLLSLQSNMQDSDDFSRYNKPWLRSFWKLRSILK